MEDPPAAPAAVAVAPADPLVLLNARMTTNDTRIKEIEGEIKTLRRGILGGVINAGQIADLRAQKTFLMQQNTEFGNQIAAIGVTQAQPPVQAQAVPQGIIFYLAFCLLSFLDEPKTFFFFPNFLGVIERLDNIAKQVKA